MHVGQDWVSFSDKYGGKSFMDLSMGLSLHQSTDEGLSVSRNVLITLYKSVTKNKTFIDYVISWLQLLNF